jgi:uncharacterized membrane protein YphA (DoxX/SURF4 family)
MSSGRQQLLDSSAAVSRWVLGVVFIYMGWVKARHPEKFLSLVHQYDLVSTPVLLNSIAAALPWFEIICGILLLTGIAVRGTAVLVLAMLIPFTLVVFNHALHIASAKAMAFCAVKFDCGCGGGEVFICRKLVENCFLMLLSGWVLCGHGRAFAVRFSLLKWA